MQVVELLYSEALKSWGYTWDLLRYIWMDTWLWSSAPGILIRTCAGFYIFGYMYLLQWQGYILTDWSFYGLPFVDLRQGVDYEDDGLWPHDLLSNIWLSSMQSGRYWGWRKERSFTGLYHVTPFRSWPGVYIREQWAIHLAIVFTSLWLLETFLQLVWHASQC